ncbi:hypothetical protein SNE40_019727 [Patella caerulea]|uniref:Uncharacterized protein n=1 Tax=Patella caerulea TaxID=87958 RepID=A0AAN8PJ89_PATCE
MKTVLVALCVVIVAAYAVDVDTDFVKSALAFKDQVMNRDVEGNLEKRAMLNVFKRKCSPLQAECNMFRPCCNTKVVKCSSFLGGHCVRRPQPRD